jgi:hypothetical protein
MQLAHHTRPDLEMCAVASPRSKVMHDPALEAARRAGGMKEVSFVQ